MLIGELSRKTNVKIDTIRFYEKEGLIKPANVRESGYREFDAFAEERLHFILRAKNLGFSLKEIKALLSLRDDPDRACSNVRSLAMQKLDEIKNKIKMLGIMKHEIKELIAECRKTEETNCPIIKNLQEGKTNEN